VTTRTFFIALLAASFATAACNAEKGADKGAAASGPVKPVAPPENGDWTTIVSQTAEGGFLMGNPNATVKIVEFGSMTCPHCAEFDAEGAKPLIDNYVKAGRSATNSGISSATRSTSLLRWSPAAAGRPAFSA
jgi:protein-disulfide isomerase